MKDKTTNSIINIENSSTGVHVHAFLFVKHLFDSRIIYS